MIRPLSEFRALTFDCYGTLIDWESGIWDALQPAIAAAGRDDVTRGPALACFARQESRQQAETPSLRYPELLTRVHAAMAKELDLPASVERDRAFGSSVPHWPAFPDSADALRALRHRFKLVILSNVDRTGFAASNRKLGVTFDAVYTAEDVGSYKPAPANFEHMLERLRADLGLGPDDVLHTAQSLFHDHVQARAHGLANAWVDRQRLSETGDFGATALVADRPETDFLFFSMSEMAAAVAAAR